MSDAKDTCPSYYRVASGAEFWEFYRDMIEPHVRDVLCPASQHALQSACEYVFRNGRKPNELQSENWQKVAALIRRAYSINSGDREAMRNASNAIATAVGFTAIERAFKEENRK